MAIYSVIALTMYREGQRRDEIVRQAESHQGR